MIDRLEHIRQFCNERLKPKDDAGPNYYEQSEGKVIKIVYRDKQDMLHRYTISLTENSIGSNMSLTDEELKLFDLLGFELDVEHETKYKQTVDDWYLKVIRMKIKIKAIDSQGADRLKAIQQDKFERRDKLVPIVEKFLSEKGYRRMKDSEPGSLYMHKFQMTDSEKRKSTMMVHLSDPISVSKTKSVDTDNRSWNYDKLTDDELKFFDNLGFDLLDLHKYYAEQQIDDWFRKAHDGKTVLEMLDAGLQELGYDSMTTRVDVGPTWMHKKDDYQIRYYTNNRWRGSATWYTVEKVESEALTIRPFTWQELRLFDSLGVILESNYSNPDNDMPGFPQSPEDWFNKAHDSLTTNEEIIDYIAEFYRKNINEDITLLKDSDGFEYGIQWDDEKIEYTVWINFEDKLIFRLKTELKFVNYQQQRDSVVSRFTNKELKLFDMLGFQLSDQYKAAAWKQDIDDWFKANDGVSVVEKLAAYFKEPEWEIEIFKRGHLTITKEADFFENIMFNVVTDEYEKEDMRMHVNKYKTFTFTDDREIMPFTNEELKFFDMLGFDLFTDAQKIDDWFKANDIDIKSSVKEFLKKMKYTVTVENKDSFIEAMISQKYSDRHRHQLILHINFSEMTVHAESRVYTRPQMKGDSERFVSSNYLALKADELRFFDNLGFEIDEEASKHTKQKIDEWFHKANDIDLKAVIKDFMERQGYVDITKKSEENMGWRFRKRVKERVTNEDKTVILKVYIASKVVEKLKSYDIQSNNSSGTQYLYELFDKQELKFFDNLGFTMDAANEKSVKQSIDSWWNE